MLEKSKKCFFMAFPGLTIAEESGAGITAAETRLAAWANQPIAAKIRCVTVSYKPIIVFGGNLRSSLLSSLQGQRTP